ncbi:MAG TPA: response regulator transcription factor [Gammaproteobacteria bacterium]
MIFLYSHDEVVRSRWHAALGSRRDVTLVAEGQPLAEALAWFPEGTVLADLSADDLRLPGRLETLCLAHPAKRLVGAYATLSPVQAIALFQAGVRGYCNRYIRAELLVELVRVVEAGEVWVGEQLMSGLLRALPRPAEAIAAEHPLLVTLTEREREVIPHLLNGQSNKAIARELQITERTVKAHVSSILHKLDVTDRMQLALLLNRPPASA